jgi:enamine deaminase RidA (YjgF/YER057c/UK114 family)
VSQPTCGEHLKVLSRAGLIATRDGQLVAKGRLGAEVDLVAGQEAARACAVNVLAQLQAAAGSLDAVTRLVKLTVYVACTGEFAQQPQVADGASKLMLDVLGVAGGPCPLGRGGRRTAPGQPGRDRGNRAGQHRRRQ